MPVVERRVVLAALAVVHEGHERRYLFLCSIIECENEGKALTALGLRDPDWSEHQPDKTSYKVHRLDRELLVRWFTGRHMLRELSANSRSLRLLTSPWAVLCWIGLPFLACILLRTLRAVGVLPGYMKDFEGIPFVLAPVLGLGLVMIYLLSRDEYFAARDRASMLIPHMVGALFLGIMERFAADENWALAFMNNPLFRLANILIFLLASIYFVRFVLLRNQRPQPRKSAASQQGVSAPAVLWRRTTSLLAMGFWLSFLFISLYSLLMGPVMSAKGRADLDPTQLPAMARDLELALPNRLDVMLIPGYLEVPVFPWAIITWTVQLFFFSAIFERIMNRDS